MLQHVAVNVDEMNSTMNAKRSVAVSNSALVKVTRYCNLSAGVTLNARFITNGMCAKNNTIYVWREQAIIE